MFRQRTIYGDYVRSSGKSKQQIPPSHPPFLIYIIILSVAIKISSSGIRYRLCNLMSNSNRRTRFENVTQPKAYRIAFGGCNHVVTLTPEQISQKTVEHRFNGNTGEFDDYLVCDRCAGIGEPARRGDHYAWRR